MTERKRAAAKPKTAPKPRRKAQPPALRMPQVSNEQLRLAIESAGIAFWQVDVATGDATVSDNYAELVGIPVDSASVNALTAIAQLVHPKDAARLTDALTATMRGQGDMHSEFRLIHPVTQKILWLEVHGTLSAGTDSQKARINGIARNITLRKETDEELRASEEKFRSLFNSIDEGFVTLELLFDDNGHVTNYRFLETNPALGKLTGLTDVVGKTALDISANVEQDWFQTFERIYLTGKAERFELPGQALDRWFDVYASRIGEEGSRIISVVYNDITERRKTEALLRHSAQADAFRVTLTDALRSLTDAGEIQDTAARILAEYLGASRVLFAEISEDEEFVGISYNAPRGGERAFRRYRPDDFGASFIRTLRSGQTLVISDVAHAPELNARAQARYAAMQVAAQVVVPVVKGGQFVFALGVYQNVPRAWMSHEVAVIEITAERTWAAVERARVEQALNAAKERVRMALEAANMGTFVWHPQQDEGEPDDRMLALFGLPPDSTLNLAAALASMIHPEDGPRYAEAVGRSLDPTTAGWLRQDIRIVYPDQSIHWLAITARTYFDDNVPPRPLYMGGMATDITARKEAEQLLQQAMDELEQRVIDRTHELAVLNQERQDLLQQIIATQEAERRRISLELHDRLGQQLTALSLQLNMVEIELNAPDKLAARLTMMRQLLLFTMDLVRSLAFDLRPSGLEYVGLPETLKNYVEEWGERFGQSVQFQSVGFEGQVTPIEVATVIYRITQEALTNILRHAQATHVSVILKRETGGVTAIIEDDGVGFVVEPGTVLNDSARSLGLLGMRERAALMGGTFEVESTAGVGTSIFVRIPIASDAPAA